jgi:hypothetical protein
MRTSRHRSCVLFFACACLAFFVVGASGDITIRVSVKAVLNPATGARQPGVTDLAFSNTIAEMNGMLRTNARGYRMQWVGNALMNVGGLNQFNSGPSQYYDKDFVNDDDGDEKKDEFEANAIANTATYGWDTSAVNIYIVRFGGANWNVCSFPGEQIILVNGAAGYSNSSVVLHEIGHYFNLSHTFLGRQNLNANGTTCTNGCSCAQFVGGGNDACADTILDHDCWDSQNDIAVGNYSLSYANLNGTQTLNVDNMWWNLMSYHNRQHRTSLFTPDQSDRWADSANSDRTSVRTGRMRFVSTTGNDTTGNGSSILRYRTVAKAVSVVNNSSDIVLVRAGSYNEPMTITTALTLRSTRGTAVIGQ